METGESKRDGDVLMEAEVVGCEAMSQGMWAASRHWESQGNGFFARASLRNTALLTP